MVQNPIKFREHVKNSLIKHVNAINKLTQRGMKFWDYGNSL
jgi:urocanate hydratase